MNLSPEIKQQLAEQKKQCTFCKIISKEMGSKIVFEDKLALAALDIRPAVKGHTLFMLKEHYPLMPYLPPEEFQHFFGLIPQLSQSIKKALLATGINVFIANGGAAGQQSPHFLIHLLPREEQDGFFNFLFDRKAKPLNEESKKIFIRNFPLLMNSHFSRNPAGWHKGAGEKPDFLAEVYDYSALLYEDEKVLVVLPNKAITPGHIEIYSKEEPREIEKLSAESSARLFSAASFAATLVFEELKAQGTNILVKSGTSDDNRSGKLCFHILPRTTGDRLQELVWTPKEPKYDLKEIAKRIEDQTWKISEGKKVEPLTAKIHPEIIRLVDKKQASGNKTNSNDINPVNEIAAAIRKIKN